MKSILLRKLARLASYLSALILAALLPTPPNALADTANESFERAANQWWQYRLQRDPLLATRAGEHRFDDQLPEVSVAASERERLRLESFREILTGIDPRSLSSANQVNLKIVERLVQNDLNELEFRMELIPITNREGFHISFPELRQLMPFQTPADYRRYIARLNGFSDYAQGHIDVMREGIDRGLTLPSAVLTGYREPITAHIVTDPTRSLLYEPFLAMPATIPEPLRGSMQAEARAAIRQSVVPGYERFLEFMKDEYVPAARGSLGASALPNGRAFYQHRIRRFTTLDLTPDEIHQTGLAEVKRIREEMLQVITELDFSGNLREFADALRDDTRFHAKSAEELLKDAALILKRMDGRLPELFATLPRTPYGLKEVPAYIAPQTTTAYYQPPPGDLTRGGFYFLNTYDLKSRPLYGLEALSLHEAVPGHHLQLALQMEMKDLPAYRRFANFTVFVEGWALYAERLGLDVGFYQDPYANFGRLTYEMWRACRLVVDTGIHYFGWTQEQAVEYMANNTALSLHNIRSEVDRYTAWPGQAVAYKTGELRIRQLRAEAEAALKEHFDVRQFHDVILRRGAVPLDVLTGQVRAWINSQLEHVELKQETSR